MKKLLTTVLIATCLGAFAQPKFTQAYKASFGFDVETRTSNKDKSMVLGWSKTQMANMSTADGKMLWNINFEKDLGQKKIEYMSHYKISKIVILYTEGSKKTPSEKFFIDETTGKVLWKTSEFGTAEEFAKGHIGKFDADGTFVGNKGDGNKFYKLRTGEFAGELLNISMTDDMLFFDNITKGDVVYQLSYEDKNRGAGAGKKESKIEVAAVDKNSGKELWRSPFSSILMATLCHNASGGSWYGATFDDVMMNWEIDGSEIFIYTDGITALDLKSGKVLWQTTFDRSDLSIGLVSKQTLNTAALPVLGTDAIYYEEIKKKSNSVKKLDRKTGKLLWESEGLKGDDVVPFMFVANNQLICQFGGILMLHKLTESACMSELEKRGNFSIRAYDVASGKQLWDTKDFKKDMTDDLSSLITNTLYANGKVYAQGQEALEILDAATGKQVLAADIKKLKLGKPIGMDWHDEAMTTLLLRCEKGVALIDAKTGEAKKTIPLDAFYGEFEVGPYYCVWVGSKADDTKDFVLIDLTNGSVVGIQKDTPYPAFSPDGSFFLKYDGELVYRFNVK